MDEKNKKFDSMFFGHLWVALLCLLCFISIVFGVSTEPEFQPFISDSYEPTAEWFYGCCCCTAIFFLSVFSYQLFRMLDILFPIKKKVSSDNP